MNNYDDLYEENLLKEIKLYRTHMLICGIITLPLIVGLVFLSFRWGLKDRVKELEESIKNNNESKSGK